MIGFVKLRILDTDEKFQLRGDTLAKAIKVSDLYNVVHLEQMRQASELCLIWT